MASEVVVDSTVVVVAIDDVVVVEPVVDVVEVPSEAFVVELVARWSRLELESRLTIRMTAAPIATAATPISNLRFVGNRPLVISPACTMDARRMRQAAAGAATLRSETQRSIWDPETFEERPADGETIRRMFDAARARGQEHPATD